MRFFKKHTTNKSVFTENEQLRITNAIAHAELTTSGEIRLVVENKCKELNPIERAGYIFYKLEMDNTKLRNGILIYLALEDKKAAIFGDIGIYEKVGSNQYWEMILNEFISFIKNDELIEGLEWAIHKLGYELSEHFPYEPKIDKNELPDEIVFGHALED